MAEWLGLGLIAFQVFLVAWLIRATGPDPIALRRVVYLAAVGFLMNHLLPLRFRPAFFATFCVGSLVVILGGTIESRIPDLALGLVRTGTLALVGLVLVGICRLPLRFWMRASLLALVGGIIAAFRADLLPSGPLAIIWPVLAAMFMFRVIVYLYDVSTARQKPSWSHSASYFLLFPNVTSLLFPVVDFRTFTNKYYDENALVIYQRGATWMARGLLHLLLYRLIDRIAAIDAASVASGTDLIHFIVFNLFLYLKVSGTFHLVIGMLLLFGFNLPETNHRYFLASSFTDYWRRVNIYWRNFIMKVFYYPAFFRCKQLGQTRALVIATLWSFFVTWALHLYQTWWIKGNVTWSWPDTLFWSSLALLVLGNSLWELKHNRQRKLGPGGFTLREGWGIATRTAATFAIIAVLWSLWSTPTLGQWLRLWTFANGSTLLWASVVLGVVMAATFAFEILPGSSAAEKPYRGSFQLSRGFVIGVARCAAPLLVLSALIHPAIHERLAAASAPQLVDVAAMVQALRQKDSDARGQGRGYYENLTAQDEGSGQYFQAMNPGQGFRYSQPTRGVSGVHFNELIPDTEFKQYDWSFRTSRWGMRDQDYELEKPARTVRLALLGSSQVMGYGLTEADMFEPIVETRLNAEHGQSGRFEILNFSIGGLSPPGQIWMLQDRVGRFAPDIVIFVAHPNDFEWSVRDVVRILRKRLALPRALDPAIFERAGVTAETPEGLAVARLRKYEADIVAGLYAEMLNECRALGALPLYLFIPVPTDLPLDPEKTRTQLELAGRAGFVVLDNTDVYSGHRPSELILKDQGRHINARGNALIAESLYQQLLQHPDIDLLSRAQASSLGR